jgi:hypothetical protein
MSHWNNRVVRQVWYPGTEREEFNYAIHETFYGIDDEHTTSITIDPTAPQGETLEELRETLQRMLRACDYPVLDYDTREEI